MMIVIPNSEVRLLSNVPLTNTYEHQMTFNSASAQSNYFIGKSSHSFNDFTYQREDDSIRVPKGRDSLYNCNYLMYRNHEFGGKWFYAFITKLEYVNPNTTKIYFEIDVFQTWQFNIEFRPSFVDREHTRRWNEDGSPVINTVPEDINYGADYDNVWTHQYVPNLGYKWLVIVSKEKLHGDTREPEASIIGTPQPLTYYILPFKDTNQAPMIYLNNNQDPVSTALNALNRIYKEEDAVNNIVSIYVTEHTGIPAEYYSGNPDEIFISNNGQELQTVLIGDIRVLHVKRVDRFQSIPHTVFEDKYSGFEDVTESKLLMYPYALTIMDDFKGNRVEIKNEYIDNKSLSINMKGSLGVHNKTSINIPDYHHDHRDGQSLETSNESALINNNAQEVPILNEYLAAYLQGNRNTLETQKSSALYGGILGGSSAIIGAIGGGLVGGPAGAVAGGALGVGQAIGSTYFQVKQIESKVQDIQNTPAQLAKHGGNTAYDYGNGYNGVFFIKKQIKPEWRKKLTDYFRMFGYKVNEVKVPNLKSRQHFNFIRTIGANIIGNVPQPDLVKIKQMFDNGVTLWHGDYVGDYSRSNNEV